MKLYFYRCLDCLHVASTTEKAEECFCGGSLSFMGYTKRDSRVLFDKSLATPCSTLCTDAAGPCCNCACGGAHHGTGRMIEVEKAVGTVPRLKVANQKALDRASEFLSLVESFPAFMSSKFGNSYKNYCDGIWISRQEWSAIYKTVSAFNQAKKLQVHKTRIKKLRGILELSAG